MNLNKLLVSLPVNRMDIPYYGFENTSNCESEEEELPPPETVTVMQDELEDYDPFPSHNVDPLSVDPLSLDHSIEPPCKPIKEELDDDSEVCVKIELSSSEDEISNVSSDHMPEDDGYRSASDKSVANKDQPKGNHLSVAQTSINEETAHLLNEILVEIENANVQKGFSTQEGIPKLKKRVHGVSEMQGNVQSRIERCIEVEHGIVDRFCGSRVEVAQNQDKRTVKESNIIGGSKATSCLEKDTSNSLDKPFTDTRLTLNDKTRKNSPNFPKYSASEKIIDGVKLLPLCSIKRRVKVVLSRCKEAEILVSSMKSAGTKYDNVVPVVTLCPNKLGENQMNSVECSQVETEKVLSKRTRSAKVVKTASALDVENDLVPGDKSEKETSVCREETISRKEEQEVSERIDELWEELPVDAHDGTVRKHQLDNGNEGAELKLWSCFICHKKFDNPFGMSGHIGHCKRREEKKQQRHPSLTNSKDHLQAVHMYKCEVCAVEFASMKGLKLHKTQVGHNNDSKKNGNLFNLNTPTTQLQGHQNLENSKVPGVLKNNLHDQRVTIFNNLCSEDNQSVSMNNNDPNTDFSPVLLSRSRNVYGCDICGMRFSNSLKLKVHALRHRKQMHFLNSSKEKVNETSSKMTGKKSSWKGFQGHSNHRLKDKLYQCNKCPKTFYSSFNFKVHLKMHRGIGPYKCEICGIAYRNLKSLKEHKTLHEHESKCGLCGISFSVSEQLENHKCSFTESIITMVKTSNNIHQATISNTNNSKGNGIHLEVNKSSSKAKKISKKNKKYPCTICGKTLASGASLRFHMYLHTGKPNQCALCNKTFSSPYRVKEHIRAWHTFERPYQCDLCDCSYAAANSLRLHKKKKHAKQVNKNMKKDKSIKQQTLNCRLIRNPIKCNECPEVLSTYGNLKRHCIRFHSKRAKEEQVNVYKCKKCEESFHSRSTLSRHMTRFHSGEAKDMSAIKSLVSSCGENEKDTLEVDTNSSATEYSGNHILNSEKAFQCLLCNKTFSSASRANDHNRRFHTFETPYRCNLCDKAYSSSDSLRRHKLLKHMQERHKKRSETRTKGGGIRKHRCDECPAKFTTSGYLLRHKNYSHSTNTNKESVEENKCEQKAASFHLIESGHQNNEHMSGIIEGTNILSASNSYLERKLIECKYCTASYDYCRSFVKHLLKKHGIKEAEINEQVAVECDLCHKRLLWQRSLKRHKREVHNIMDTEEEVFENVHPKHKALSNLPDNLLRHTRQTDEINNTYALNSQSTDQIYKCDMCDAVFNQNSLLLEHNASFHVGNKSKKCDFKPSRKYYKCNLCNAKYFNKSSLGRHTRSVHLEEGLEEDVFQCSVCHKTFSSAIVLIKHHEKHFKNLKHSCSTCGKSFDQLQHLEDHMLVHHNPASLYNCDICSLSLQTLDDLENHKRSHKLKSSLRVGQSKCRKQVPQNYRCDVCNKLFTRKDGLRRHKLIHATICIYQCKICSLTFQERYKLVLHSRTHFLFD